jgi:hypothetical protein
MSAEGQNRTYVRPNYHEHAPPVHAIAVVARLVIGGMSPTILIAILRKQGKDNRQWCANAPNRISSIRCHVTVSRHARAEQGDWVRQD